MSSSVRGSERSFWFDPALSGIPGEVRRLAVANPAPHALSGVISVGDEPPAWNVAIQSIPAHLEILARVQGQRIHTAVMNRNPRLTHPLLFHSPLSSLCPASNQSKRKGEHDARKELSFWQPTHHSLEPM